MYNHLDKSPETYTEWKQLVSNGFILYHSVYMTFFKWQKFQEFERISRIWASLVAQRVKYLPAMRETWVWSLGWEDPLEKGMAIHSSILPWRIPWTEEPCRIQFMGSQKVRHNWATKHNTAVWLSFSQPCYLIYLESQFKWSCSVMSDCLQPRGL